MVLESLDNGSEAVIVQSEYLSVPVIHFLHCPCGRYFLVEYAAEAHRKVICLTEDGIVFEQYVDAVFLNVSPSVGRHHQRVLAACQYLTHGLAV